MLIGCFIYLQRNFHNSKKKKNYSRLIEQRKRLSLMSFISIIAKEMKIFSFTAHLWNIYTFRCLKEENYFVWYWRVFVFAIFLFLLLYVLQYFIAKNSSFRLLFLPILLQRYFFYLSCFYFISRISFDFSAFFFMFKISLFQ